VHFHHFRHWRACGIAYELRDSTYLQPNRTLLSTARGRVQEFKDCRAQDIGRSVSAYGFWADILNCPFIAFGITCEDKSFFKATNKHFAYTSVDVAEHNIRALLYELRHGQPLEFAEEGTLRVAETDTDTAAHARLRKCLRLALATGDLTKTITSRAKFKVGARTMACVASITNAIAWLHSVPWPNICTGFVRFNHPWRKAHAHGRSRLQVGYLCKFKCCPAS